MPQSHIIQYKQASITYKLWESPRQISASNTYFCGRTQKHRIMSVEMQVITFLVLWVAAAGALRNDVYRTTCPGHAASAYVVRQQDLPVRSRIQCVALCQRDQRCSSIIFSDNLCSLITSNETSCEDREVGQGSVERVSSNWCSHGGQLASHDNCTCPQPYTGPFCTIRKWFCFWKICWHKFINTCITRGTRRVQNSLAEADHYPPIAC